jgi:hypothetical protein
MLLGQNHFAGLAKLAFFGFSSSNFNLQVIYWAPVDLLWVGMLSIQVEDSLLNIQANHWRYLVMKNPLQTSSLGPMTQKP